MIENLSDALEWLLEKLGYFFEKLLGLLSGLFVIIFNGILDFFAMMKDKLISFGSSLISVFFDFNDLSSFFGNLVFFFIGLILLVFVLKRVFDLL